uniref:Nuclear transcription factor Y subunit B-4 n=1 Tax=Cicer arietinum TaxID=3827 RepID=A0A1S2XXF4_CICAR|nr:nuclear transcription factor Y subunit B-4 [Cicer arietinum]
MKSGDGEKTLPIANVGRIMKQNLPPNAKISKESKELMQESVTEFISFVTGEASEKCQKENRKSVNGDDICWALCSLGFDNYAEAIGKFGSEQAFNHYKNRYIVRDYYSLNEINFAKFNKVITLNSLSQNIAHSTNSICHVSSNLNSNDLDCSFP